MCYLKGIGVAKDQGIAMTCIGIAAALGNANALYWAGRQSYQHKKYTDAIEFLRKASQKKHKDALALLGVCYLLGNGVEKNYKKGEDLLHEAARLGSPLALEILDKCK